MNDVALLPVETSAAIMAVASAAPRQGQKIPSDAVARDVMIRNPPQVACDDTLLEVVGMMRSLLVAFLPVCDTTGALRGIVALRDLQHAGRGDHPTATTAVTLAREPAVTIGVDDPVDGVWDLMAEQRMWLLPVMDGRRLAGVIRYAAHPVAGLRGIGEQSGARSAPAVS